MSVRCFIFFVMCVGVFFLNAFAGSAEEQKAFDGDELKKFCRELPIILNSMNNEEKERFFKNTLRDYSHTVLPESIMRDSRLSLQPQRYIYMLNHIILAGVIEDMGGFGEGQLDFLKNEREKVENNQKIPSSERERILAELENDIDRLNDTIAQTKSIPKFELVLIWKEKEELNALLRGKFPIQKKQMARQ
jgi:hypothetical protein